MCLSDAHFRNMGTKLAMDARAVDAASDERLRVHSSIACHTYHIKMPKLWEAHRGFRDLQSAQMSWIVMSSFVE